MSLRSVRETQHTFSPDTGWVGATITGFEIAPAQPGMRVAVYAAVLDVTGTPGRLWFADTDDDRISGIFTLNANEGLTLDQQTNGDARYDTANDKGLKIFADSTTVAGDIYWKYVANQNG